MARLLKEIRFKIDDAFLPEDAEVFVTLRRPTPKETSDFMGSRWEAGKGGRMKDYSHEARCEFFDLLLTKVEGFEGDDGQPVTPERKELIPGNWKGTVILKNFELIEIDSKNF